MAINRITLCKGINNQILGQMVFLLFIRINLCLYILGIINSYITAIIKHISPYHLTTESFEKKMYLFTSRKKEMSSIK